MPPTLSTDGSRCRMHREWPVRCFTDSNAADQLNPVQVEFGKPSELLENEKGLFRALVDESGDREKLYAIAMGASVS